jgi:hypothetical protein
VTISDSELEAGLRDLRSRAAVLAPPPEDLAQRTRERYRARRRSRAALAAGGLVALVVLVGVPVVAATVAEAPRGEVADPSERTSAPSRAPSLYSLPTRGSLADDDDWLTDVAALDWGPVDPALQPPGTEVPEPPLDSRKVAFAGDVPSGRVALVLGLEDNRLVHAWFTGSEGAAADEMELASFPSASGHEDALALRDAPDPTIRAVTLVVVGQPGDTVDIGLTPVVEASGETRADRLDVDVEDGIATVEVDIPEPFWRTGGDVRVRRSGGADRGMTIEDSDRLRGDVPSPPLVADIRPADPRGLLDRTDPAASAWPAASQVADYGLTAEQAGLTLLAAGPLGARVDQYGELYGMTHPSGATSTWLVTYSPGAPDRGSSLVTFPPAPAGTALLDRVIAVQAMAGLLVSAPSGVEAQVVDDSGAVLLTVPLERGAATAPFTDQRYGSTVRILGADGDVLAETPLVGQ